MGTLNLFTSTHVFQVRTPDLSDVCPGLFQEALGPVATDAGPKGGVSPPLFTRSFINEVLKSNQPPHSSTPGTELGFGMRFFSSFASLIPSPSEKMGADLGARLPPLVLHTCFSLSWKTSEDGTSAPKVTFEIINEEFSNRKIKAS